MSAKTADELVAKLRRDLNSLSDENRGVRRRAVKNLEKALLIGKHRPKPKVLTECFNLHVVEPLTNLLSDPVESCRESSCELISQLVESGRLRDAYPLLSCCMPIMLKRLGTLPFFETSEEVRLLDVQLLLQLLQTKSCRRKKTRKTTDADSTSSTSTAAATETEQESEADALEGGSAQDDAVTAPGGGEASVTAIKKRKASPFVPFEKHLGDICQILATCLRDKFPDVKKVTAAAIDEVSGLLPHLMHLHLGLLVDPLLKNIQHTQNAVRSSALNCLGRLVICGSEQLPKLFREKLVPAMYSVLEDQTPLVRKHQVEVITSWLKSRDKCLPRDPEMQATVFSILLAAVGDTTEEVAKLAISRIEDVAEVWYGDQVNSAEDGAEAASEEPVPINKSRLSSDHLPAPFTSVPTQASQKLMCSLLKVVLPPVLHALSDWKVGRRLATVAMLQAIFVFGHRQITRHLPKVLSAIVLQVCDDEKAMAEALCNCAETLGGCVDPEAILAILLPWVRCEFKKDEPIQSQKNTLLTLASCVDGMPDGSIVPHLEDVAKALCHPAVTNCEDGDIQFQVTEAVLSVVDKAGQLDTQTRAAKGEDFFFDLLRTLLNLVALGDDSVRKQALEGIESLAEMLDLKSPQDLYRRHFSELLKIATSDHEQWQKRTSPGFGFFESLLRECEPSIVATCVSDDFLLVLERACDPKRDATLRVQILALIETLVSGSTGGIPTQHTSRPVANAGQSPVAVALRKYGDVLLEKILAPNLAWKVGRVEGTIRKLAVACLITVLTHNAVTLPQLLHCLGQLIPTLTSTLSDDYDTPMRHLSCIAMERLLNLVKGQVGSSFASDLYPELLKRLDDSSDDVRKAIAPCLSAFFRVATPEMYGTTLREYTLDMLLVHLDDQDQAIQNAIFDVLTTMMENLDDDFLDLMQKKAGTARAQHRSPKYCDKLLATVEEIQGRVSGAE